ncbi:transketolase [Bacillus fonticola]|uniref:transketolase n=1 Tax=Bacillus fonticola TaxID=2728853 RepID=UPI001475D715|nr:transketolase [Bacillus fonticola]
MIMNQDQLSINTIRTLSIDAIEKAKSGHPGMPMGAAPMTYTLWTKFMNQNPQDATWFNRDRFVLSAGHGSMLLYSMLHLAGYDLSMDDLKEFRQWGSKTPGHPEFRHTHGVEATTGPLGQGIAMAVGMAMAEKHLSAKFNRPDHSIVDHYTYTICGDGDLMEGISSEACSLAGHLKLGKLVVLYDSNDISLDGDLHKSFSENIEQRFTAYGWHYIKVEDGNDVDEISKAIEQARLDQTRPTMIEVKTVIGYGSPNKSGTSGVHGSPLGGDEAKLTKEAYKWTFEKDFHVPEEVYEHFRVTVQERGQKAQSEWESAFSAYKKAFPVEAEQLDQAIRDELPKDWDRGLPNFTANKGMATRASSGELVNALADGVPSLFGGSADLAGSNKTMIKSSGDFSHERYDGRNVWFGVREFAMAAALNGMALHGGLKVFGGTFFVFSDYLRPALRLSALMGVPVTYVLTHDSIAVGEDGPTHEPVEQLPSLRAMPNVNIVRPADAKEVKAAWKEAVTSKNEPTVLVLTRQDVPTLDLPQDAVDQGVKKGAYVVRKSSNDTPDLLLLATGSEVGLVLSAQEELSKDGIDASVVSMPSWSRFDAQDASYKESVLPRAVKKRLAVEMARPFGWEKYTGTDGDIIGVDTFGASAPGEIVLKEYGFTVENVVARAKALIESK